MFTRKIVFVILLAVALVGPAVYFNQSGDDPNDLNQFGLSSGNIAGVPAFNASYPNLSPGGLAAPVAAPVASIPAASPFFQNDLNPSRLAAINSPPATPFPQHSMLPGNAYAPDFNSIPLEFMPVTTLDEIFRFDINPAWVKQRWERVSNSPGAAGLSGFRVPLVTGVNTYDLFGSLTYYFDSKQTLQKITFRGWSGNPEGLVNLVTTSYGFKNKPTTGAGLYLANRRRKSTGVLYMQHPNVIRAENPTQQVAILLEINNPNGPFVLSPEVESLVLTSSR